MMAAQAAADGSPGAWCDRSTRGDVICPQALSTGVGNCVPYFEGKGAGSSPVEVRRIIAPASSATPRRRAVLATFFPADRTADEASRVARIIRPGPAVDGYTRSPQVGGECLWTSQRSSEGPTVKRT